LQQAIAETMLKGSAVRPMLVSGQMTGAGSTALGCCRHSGAVAPCITAASIVIRARVVMAELSPTL
jgi:hypothetical protein